MTSPTLKLALSLQHQSEEQYQGESLQAAGDVTGHHRVKASLDSKKSLVKASGAGWIKALPEGRQILFSLI